MNNDKGFVNVAFDTTSENVVTIKLPRSISVTSQESKHPTENNKVVDVETVEEKERPTWGHGLEFLMSCISMSVGLGNIWRFPFTAYENGGGAFLIPYIIVLLLIGKPLYYMEMILGQFTSRGSVKIWQALPAFKGVGIGQMFGTLCVLTYYCSLIALTLFYMVKSFASELPWAKCWSTWSENCIDSSLLVLSGNRSNDSSSSSELYFKKEVIKESYDIADGIGAPDLALSAFLFLAWVFVFIVIVRGVKSSGKFSYFLALFPYFVMLILLIRACTLEGALNGIIYFIKPDFSKLLSPQVWYKATTQLFFSLSVGMGTVTMFSSYNQFDHNIYRDAMIVTTLDTFTSMLGGFTIFGILGNLAYNLGESDVSKVITSGGSALAFMSYPEAIAKFQTVPQLFSILFFFMLFTLGIGSAVALQSSIITNIMDHLPSGKFKYWQIAGAGCFIGFLAGLVYVTPGGQWMLTLVDHFGGTFLIFALAILQLIGIVWIYGLEDFCWDVEFMLGRHVTPYWRWSWGFITPVIMIIIFVYSMVNLENPTYGIYEFPAQYITAGWIIFLVGAFQVIIWSLWVFSHKHNKINEDYPHSKVGLAMNKMFTPSSEWGPKNAKRKEEWMRFKNEARQKRDTVIQMENHTRIQQILNTLFGKYRNI